VGAADLLRPDEGELLTADLTRPAEAAAVVDELLGDPARLSGVGEAAAARALSWDERANARELVAFVRESVAAFVKGGSVLPRHSARHQEL
jgi:hypothetical protein